jgi:hypothetical protein
MPPFALISSRGGTLAVGLLLLSTRASALDIVVKNVHTPASSVTATIEVRDPLPDRFRRLIDEGAVLHLRVQTELWESRPVWDRLVFPAIVRVFRLARATSGRQITITDPNGGSSTHATVPSPMPVQVELGKTDRITASAKYYVHALATIGTIADREADDVGDAVFGRESESNTLGSLGRAVFKTMIKVGDYLQSVSAETTTRNTAGADLLKP